MPGAAAENTQTSKAQTEAKQKNETSDSLDYAMLAEQRLKEASEKVTNLEQEVSVQAQFLVDEKKKNGELEDAITKCNARITKANEMIGSLMEKLEKEQQNSSRLYDDLKNSQKKEAQANCVVPELQVFSLHRFYPHLY